MKSTDLPILPFTSKKKWADWLAKQHDKSAGVWLKLAKKGSEIPSVTYDEALEVALCYGWIEARRKVSTINIGSRNLRGVDPKASGPRSIRRKRRN